MMRSLIFGVLIALSAASCQQGVIYTQTLDLPLGKWQADQVLETQFASPDTTRNYDLFLDINHNEEYHYENVYLQIETLFPHKDPVTQVLPIDLADKKGKWHGKCGGGDCDLRVVLKQQIKFQAVGDYQINISQYSRDASLDGINGLEFSVVESD